MQDESKFIPETTFYVPVMNNDYEGLTATLREAITLHAPDNEYDFLPKDGPADP